MSPIEYVISWAKAKTEPSIRVALLEAAHRHARERGW